MRTLVQLLCLLLATHCVQVTPAQSQSILSKLNYTNIYSDFRAAVGTTSGLMVYGTKGVVLLSTDNGESWISKSIPNTNSAVIFVGSLGENVYAFLRDGAVYRYSKTQSNWVRESPLSYLATPRFTLCEELHAIVIYDSNKILLFKQNQQIENLVDNLMFEPRSLSVMGHQLIMSNDTAVQFVDLVQAQIGRISNFREQDTCSYCTIYGSPRVMQDRIYINYGPFIYASTDSMLTWHKGPECIDNFFVDKDTVLTVSRVYLNKNSCAFSAKRYLYKGGDQQTMIDSTYYHEYDTHDFSIEGGLFFNTNNIIVVGSYNTLLISRDGGKNWLLKSHVNSVNAPIMYNSRYGFTQNNNTVFATSDSCTTFLPNFIRDASYYLRDISECNGYALDSNTYFGVSTLVPLNYPNAIIYHRSSNSVEKSSMLAALRSGSRVSEPSVFVSGANIIAYFCVKVASGYQTVRMSYDRKLNIVDSTTIQGLWLHNIATDGAAQLFATGVVFSGGDTTVSVYRSIDNGISWDVVSKVDDAGVAPIYGCTNAIFENNVYWFMLEKQNLLSLRGQSSYLGCYNTISKKGYGSLFFNSDINIGMCVVEPYLLVGSLNGKLFAHNIWSDNDTSWTADSSYGTARLIPRYIGRHRGVLGTSDYDTHFNIVNTGACLVEAVDSTASGIMYEDKFEFGTSGNYSVGDPTPSPASDHFFVEYYNFDNINLNEVEVCLYDELGSVISAAGKSATKLVVNKYTCRFQFDCSDLHNGIYLLSVGTHAQPSFCKVVVYHQ